MINEIIIVDNKKIELSFASSKDLGNNRWGVVIELIYKDVYKTFKILFDEMVNFEFDLDDGFMNKYNLNDICSKDVSSNDKNIRYIDLYNIVNKDLEWQIIDWQIEVDKNKK